jgi:hypothetical protein
MGNGRAPESSGGTRKKGELKTSHSRFGRSVEGRAGYVLEGLDTGRKVRLDRHQRPSGRDGEGEDPVVCISIQSAVGKRGLK